MLRISALSVALVLFAAQACQDKKSKAPANPPVQDQLNPEPTKTPDPEPKSEPKAEPKEESKPAPVAAVAKIDDFSHDPVAALEANVPTVTVKWHWASNVDECTLRIGEDTRTVKGKGDLETSIDKAVEAELTCQTAAKKLSIELAKKISITSLKVNPSQDGEQITWEAFAAKSCELTDAAHGIRQTQLPGSGSLLVKAADGPLNIQLECADEAGTGKASATYDVASALKSDEILSIIDFKGPAEPIKHNKHSSTVKADLHWLTNGAERCQIGTSILPAKGQQTLDVNPASVTLECYGARFQKAQKTVSLAVRHELQILKLAVPADGLHGSSRPSWQRLEVEIFGASLCKATVDDGTLYSRNWVGTENIEELVDISLLMNVTSKEVHLSCSNVQNETVSATLPVRVGPRVDVVSVSSDPPKVYRPWNDKSSHNITLKWTAENYQRCEVSRLTDGDEIVLPSSGTSLVTDINRTTDFRVRCFDAEGLQAYQIITVEWEREPVLEIKSLASSLAIKGFGLKSCTVIAYDLTQSWNVKADSDVIDSTIYHLRLMRDTDFDISCKKINGGDLNQRVSFHFETPKFFVARNAVLKPGKISFEAAWNLPENARACALVQGNDATAPKLLSPLPSMGSERFELDFGIDKPLQLSVLCGEAFDQRLYTEKLVHPVTSCDKNMDDLIDLVFYSRGTWVEPVCSDIVEELQSIEKLEVDGNPSSQRNVFLPFLNHVKTVKLGLSGNFMADMPYLAHIKNLQYDFTNSWFALQGPEVLTLLKDLRSFQLHYKQGSQLDLRFLKDLSNLDDLDISGEQSRNGQDIGSILHFLPVTKLKLRDMAIQGHLVGIGNLFLKELSFDRVDCYRPWTETKVDCFIGLPVLTEKRAITSVEIGTNHFKSLEKIYDASKVEKLIIRTSQDNVPALSDYKILRHLVIRDNTDLSPYTRAPLKSVKTLELVPAKGTALVARDVNTAFPNVEALSLNGIALDSFSTLWKLTLLKELALTATKVEHWDVPMEGRTLRRLTLNRIPLKEFWSTLEGLHIDVLVSDSMYLNADDLVPGVIDTMDLRNSVSNDTAQKQLESLYGKVKTILLPDHLVEGLQPAVKACTLRRVMNGTTLVYPGFDADWKACESL